MCGRAYPPPAQGHCVVGTLKPMAQHPFFKFFITPKTKWLIITGVRIKVRFNWTRFCHKNLWQNLKSLPPPPPTCIYLCIPDKKIYIYYVWAGPGRAYPPHTCGYTPLLLWYSLTPLPNHRGRGSHVQLFIS